MDALLRVDVAILGLLLACTLALIVRVSRSYRSARQNGIDSPTGKRSVATLRAHAGNLNSIATVAPYFGLLGTCLGIVNALYTNIGQVEDLLMAVMSRMAPVLVPCAVGIIVAVPATCGHAYASTRLELLARGLPNPRLTSRITNFPPFAIVPAFLLIVIFRVFMVITPMGGYSPKGFDIGIAPARCASDSSEELTTVLRISNEGRIYLNEEEEQDWSSLQSRLSEIYRMRAQGVLYFSADEGVPYQTVADALDNVRGVPEDITVQLITPRAMNAPCAEATEDKRLLEFKQRMTARVGTQMTIRGRLNSGKDGYWISFQGWSVDIVALHDADLDRLNALSPMENREVQLSGVLRYSPGAWSGSNSVQSVPEHFYFDVAETRTTIVPQSSRQMP